MTDVVGWDLDSSVASTMHRRWMIPEIRAGRNTWHAYSALCTEDEPIEGAVALMRLMSDMDPAVLHVAISGRSVRARDLTEGWAHLHDVPFDRFMLRPDDQDNGKWKVKCIRQLHYEGYRMRLFVEDWAPAARYIREQTGVPVLGVNPFDPDTCLVGREQLAMELDQELEIANQGNRELADRIYDRIAHEHA